MHEFAVPTLQKFNSNFYPGVESVKELIDCHYSFQYRRVWAKIRRVCYFISESEKLYRSLIYDELKHYNIYEFEVPDQARVEETGLDSLVQQM